MNIFLPYPRNIVKSVNLLDDRRLIKQILECKQIYSIVNRLKNGEMNIGYSKHPVVQHYKTQLEFLVAYGTYCCIEYQRRFSRTHLYEKEFFDMFKTIPEEKASFSYQETNYVPAYISGPKPNQIYTTSDKEVGKLFIEKLNNKWEKDRSLGRPPKWTNCDKNYIV